MTKPDENGRPPRRRKFGSLPLDKYQLDKEWAEISDEIDDWCGREADADKEVADAEVELALVESELRLRILADPSAFEEIPEGLPRGKLTEKIVDAAIIHRKKYQRLRRALIDAKHNLATIKGRVKALMVKKTAIENEVILHGRGYWSEPRVPKEIEQEAKENFRRTRADREFDDVRRSKH